MQALWTDDDRYFIWQGEVRIPKTFDPSTKAAVIMLGPPGGVAEIPALVKGDPGLPASIDTNISFTSLAYDDPTSDSASFTLLTPATATEPAVYRLALALHEGTPGESGSSAILDSTDLTGTAVDGYVLAKTTVTGTNRVTWVAQKVGDQYWPASISNTTGTDGQNRTLASVSIPAQPFDYRLRVFGQAIISGTANTRVDLIARLGNATSGDIIGRAFGITGATPPPSVLVSGPPTGSSSSAGKVLAGNAAVVFLRAEQQASTTDAYTTSASTTSFMVEVAPIASFVASGS